MPEQVPLIPFVLLAGAIVGGAGAMLLSRNVVHAAFWLLEVMVAVAGLFLLLSAEFLALVQLMVYAGAVSVLVLFTVGMSVERWRSREGRPGHLWLVAVLTVAAVSINPAGPWLLYYPFSYYLKKDNPSFEIVTEFRRVVLDELQRVAVDIRDHAHTGRALEPLFPIQ